VKAARVTVASVGNRILNACIESITVAEGFFVRCYSPSENAGVAGEPATPGERLVVLDADAAEGG
jgi:hypothetical protein